MLGDNIERREHAALLTQFSWNRDGSLSGAVVGKIGYRDGDWMTTSYVSSTTIVNGTQHVTTVSGSCYWLGEEVSYAREFAPRQRSTDLKRSSTLDTLESGPISDSPLLSFAVGGNELGGAYAKRILQSFDLDDDLLRLRRAYAAARRVVLFNGEDAVAAAIVEVHQGVLLAPILATARAYRRQGFGSVMVALLRKLGRQLGLGTLLVASTGAAVSFWLRAGFQKLAHCPSAVRSSVRSLEQSGLQTGAFADSVPLATPLNSADHCDIAAAVDSIRAGLLSRASKTKPRSMGPGQAALSVGYMDINSTGNIWLRPDGTRVPVEYSPHELLPVETEWVDYDKLRVFQTRSCGLGLRCTAPIIEGQVVMEVMGQV